jgi:uncharacterized cupin superfamily protein
MKIKVEKPTDDFVEKNNIRNWPIWTKEASEFPWTCDEKESCLILEGQVFVTPEGGEPVEINAGDYVEFPRGMRCVWKITKDIRKHYNFG